MDFKVCIRKTNIVRFLCNNYIDYKDLQEHL